MSVRPGPAISTRSGWHVAGEPFERCWQRRGVPPFDWSEENVVACVLLVPFFWVDRLVMAFLGMGGGTLEWAMKS